MNPDYTRIIKRLIPEQDSASTLHRKAVVDAINSDGTVDLDFGGTSVLPGISVLAGARLEVGDAVQIISWRGDLLVLGAVAEAPQSGYMDGGTVSFTSSGSFSKGSYPGLRAVRVRMVGGGGAGGGAEATSAGQGSVGMGGGGGAYAESFVLASDLATSEAVTVGAGGTTVSGNDGNDGGDSIFDTISGEVRADAGQGGTTHTTTATIGWQDITNGGTSGNSTGDIRFTGGGGFGGFSSAAQARGGGGGGTVFVPRGAAAPNGSNQNGNSSAGLYGCGGSGGSNAQSQGSAKTGGAGGAGLVLVDLLY